MIRWLLNWIHKPEEPDQDREEANRAFNETVSETQQKLEAFSQETDNLSETIKEMRKKVANGN